MKKRTVVVLCFVLVALTLLSACSVANSPSGIVKKFMDAAKSGNANAMFDCFEPDKAEAFKSLMALAGGEEAMIEQMGFAEGMTYSIEGENISGDKATVSVKVTMNGESETDDVPCVKVDGNWYIYLGF
jgi:hypothetical protein